MKITVRLTGTGTHLARRLALIAARRLGQTRLRHSRPTSSDTQSEPPEPPDPRNQTEIASPSNEQELSS